jgi:hypothetical protein
VTSQAPATPPSDDRDWTVVLDAPCAECGYDAAAITGDQVPQLALAATQELAAALGRPGAEHRPAELTWSALEYGCHVRDVCRIFDARLIRMLTEDDPLFANWDQDATAIQDAYWAQVQTVVAGELDAAAAQIAVTIDGIAGDQWSRPGRRSNGSVFTVDTLSRYFLHDLVHHAHDVSP